MTTLPSSRTRRHPIGRIFHAIRQPLIDADAESLAWQQQQAGRIDARTIIVLTAVAIALTIQQFVFNRSNLPAVPGLLDEFGLSSLATNLRQVIEDPASQELARLTFWAGGCFTTYVLVPLITIWLLARFQGNGESTFRVRDCGLKVRGGLASAPIYLAMLVFMLPAVWFFSTTETFQDKYPFYRLGQGEPLWPRFLVWELLYALQFVSLEFFFRGFILHGTKHRFGGGAIWVMMVPYCMIHFSKPMPECFGAIVAGIVLGYMSLKTRSIWWGAALHISVAWTMDSLAVWHATT